MAYSQDYIEFVRRRWAFLAIVVAAAMATAGVASLLATKRYTASATILIDPPGTGDPRLSTAISPAYLESLKSFEQFASSDTLFLKACQQFDLLTKNGASSVERFKQRVLTVEKLKDTRLLRIGVTLPDPGQAQAVAQFIAEQTVQLNRGLAQEGDRSASDEIRGQLAAAQASLNQAREVSGRETAQQSQLDQETLDLREAKARTQQLAADAGVDAAEYAAQESALKGTTDTDPVEISSIREKAAGARARQTALNANLQDLDRRLQSKEAARATTLAQHDRADAEYTAAQSSVNELRKRANDQAATAGLRTEQLRIVDPGIVPQRPSSPDIPLILAAAFALSLTAALVFLTFQYRFGRPQSRPARTELRMASGGR